MDVNALRTLGIAVSALLIAGALALSFTAPEPALAQTQELFETAQAQAAEPVAFIVRFRGTGPIARAQAQAARGQMVAAQRGVEAQLRRQSAFAGLCFDRFTVGGAEIVLRLCDAIAVGERAAAQQTWVARLRAMRAVEYVDSNAVVSPGRAG